MAIIIHFIIRNIIEKKFRTFLILFSITLSAALFFASVALSGTIEQTFMQRIKKYFGTAQIVIWPNEKSPYWLHRIRKMEKLRDRFEYVVGAIEAGATYDNKKETVNIDLKGYYLEDLQKINPYMLKQEANLYPFTGRKIIISRKLADKFQFRIGQYIELLMDGNKHYFEVVGIAETYGMFQEDGQSNTTVVPRETLAGMFYAPGAVSVIYFKLKDPSRLFETISDLSKEYRRYTVREPVSWAELKRYTQSVTTPFLIMVVLVLFMSVFIIYSSFKVITRERLPVIGTFRSIGATRRMTDLVLFLESLFYGILGGTAGCILGFAILYLMSVLMTPAWLRGVKTSIQFTPVQLIGTFVLALIIPLISSFIPIVKISKFSVKDIVLNSMEKPKPKRSFRLIIGVFSLIFAIVAPFLAPKQWALYIDVLSMLLAVSSIVIMVPYITSWFLKLFEHIYTYLLGNEGVLAAKNLRENKSILNNISLLAIGISSLLMINTVSFSVIKEVANLFKDATFEVWSWFPQADRRLEGIIRTVDGVKDTYGIYAANRIEVDGTKERINLLQGINTNRYLDYWNISVDGNREQLIRQLDNDRNIMLSFILKDKLEVQNGDLLTLRMKKGNRIYRVIGFFNSLNWGGSHALMAEKYLKLDMSNRYYDNIYIKTSKDPSIVIANLQKKFKRYRPWMETKQQISDNEVKSQQQMFLILQGFSLMTLIIGVFGVFNNLIISFLERKRSIAMMRSVGMSKQQTLKIILIESLTGGIIGGIVGIIAGTILVSQIPFVMRAINQIAPIHYSFREYLIAFGAGIFITVLASISPALNSSKINIIEAIKYE